jgi:hypothetical protein
LVAGEQRSVVLGSPAMASDWRGRVLLPRGSPLSISMLVELELDDDGVASRHGVDEHGAFDLRVPAGTYVARLCFATGGRVSFGELEVAAGASVRDLVVPNAVRVRPTFVAGALEPKWPEASLRARLRASSGFVWQSARGRDGFEYFLGLDAGDYELQCWPHPIAGAPPAGIPVTVPASDELEVDVVVERR